MSSKPGERMPAVTPADILWRASPGRAVRVLDVGANPINGTVSYQPLLQAGRAEVTGFEPQPEALAELLARKSDAETYLPHALGDGTEGVLHLYHQSGFTSLFPLHDEMAALLGFRRATREVGRVPVATHRLDDLDDLTMPDFLKIDVQGSELAVISNGRQTLGEAVLVQTEVRFVPLYKGEPTFGDLQRELLAQGFLFHDFADLKRVALHRRTGPALRRAAFRQVVDGDAFFVRDLTGIADWTDRQIWALALLGEVVVRSPSLVLLCLDALAERGAASGEVTEAYLAALPPRLRK